MHSEIFHFQIQVRQKLRIRFLEGVLLLHNFEYADAARSFRKAQEIDPGFILAYWGEAMTHNHPIWMQQYTSEAEKALQKLGPTSTKRLEKTKDSREKAYLQSVEILFGFDESSIGKSKEERDFLYNESLKKLMETIPMMTKRVHFTDSRF